MSGVTSPEDESPGHKEETELPLEEAVEPRHEQAGLRWPVRRPEHFLRVGT